MATIPPTDGPDGGTGHAGGEIPGGAEKVEAPVEPGAGASAAKGEGPVIDGTAQEVHEPHAGTAAAGAATETPAGQDAGANAARTEAAQGSNTAEAAKKSWGERISQKRKEIGESFKHEFDAEGNAVAGSEISAGEKYGIKGGVAALGGLGMIDGVRRMASKDEGGNRHWVVGGVEFAGGAGAAYWALTKKFAQKAVETAARAG